MLFLQIISRAVFFIPLIYYSTVPSARPPVSAFLLTFSESAARIGEDVWRAGGETRAILLALLPPARRAISIWANQATTRVLELATAFNLSRAQRSNNSLRSVPDLHAPSLQPVPRSAAHLFVYFYHLAEQSPASSLAALELSAVILSGERSAVQQLPVLTLPNHHPLESVSEMTVLRKPGRLGAFTFSSLSSGFSLADGAGMPVVAPLTRIMIALAVVPVTPTPSIQAHGIQGPLPALPATEEARPPTPSHGLASQPLTPRPRTSPVRSVHGCPACPPPPTLALSRSIASPATPQWSDTTLALHAGFGCTSPTPGSDLSVPVLFWGRRAPPSSSTTSTSSTAATQPDAGSSRLAPPTTPGTVEWDVTAEQDLAGTHCAAQMEELLGSEVSMLLDLPHILAAAMVETTDVAAALGSPPCPRTPSPPTTPGFRRARLPPSPSPQPRALGTAASYMELHELSGSPSVPPLPRDRTTLFRSSPSRSSPPRSSSSRSSPSAPGVLLPTLIHRSTSTLPAAASIMSIAELGSPVRLLPRAAQAQVAMYGSPGSAGWLEVQAWIAGRVSILRSIRRRSVGMGMLEVEEVVGEVVEMLEEADESGFLLRVSQAHASVTHEGHGAVLEEVSGDPRVAEFQRQVAQFCEGMIPTPPVRALVSEFVRQRVVLERSVVLADVTPSVFNVTPGPAVVEEGEGEADENIPPSATALGKRKAVEDVFYPS